MDSTITNKIRDNSCICCVCLEIIFIATVLL
jgi:hypothetical protein